MSRKDPPGRTQRGHVCTLPGERRRPPEAPARSWEPSGVGVPERLARSAGRFACRLLARAAPILLVAIAPGCSSPDSDGERPGALVLIVIDTLRGDRLGCTGYPTAVTPNLDALASRGTRFSAAMTPAPVTLPAVASLLTGRLPFQHGVRDNDAFVLEEDEVTLAERFRRSGWRTSAIVASAVLAADRGLAQGFETYDDAFGADYPVYDPEFEPLALEFANNRRRADEVTDRAVARLQALGDEPFFLLVHYFDPHMVYDPPSRYRALHADPYDGEISFVDAEMGRLLAALSARSDALVVVVADHGESLGEHGEPQHGFLVYESTLHIPMIVAGPGVPAGFERNDVVSLVDLEPTLARIFALKDVDSDRDGRALTWATPESELRTHYAETFHTLVSYDWSELRALRRGRWKLIQSSVAPPELYDLALDPHELRPKNDAAVVADLAAELAEHVGNDDPEQILAGARRREHEARRKLLKSLGYLSGPGGGGGGRRPHPRERLPAWLERQSSKTYTRRAIAAIDAGQPEVALGLLDSALALNPAQAEAYLRRGQVWARRGDAAGAQRDFQRSLELAVEQRPLVARFMESVSTTGALPVQADDAAIRDEAAAAIDYLARLRLLEEDPEGAIVYLRWLSEHRPGDASTHYNLGLAAYRTERFEEARAHLQTYVELAPDDPKAAAVKRLLREKLTPDRDPPG